MSQPINNALSNFDNFIEETSGGKTGFASKLTSSLSSSSLSELAGNLTSNLTSSVGSFLSDNIKKLNELTKSVADKFGITDKLSKLQDFANKYLSNGLDFLNDMKSDALKQLKNASVNYVSNIAEDFEKQLMSTVYADERSLATTLKTLYYQGADLAYNDHYIRKTALSRDWNETLKFLDDSYNIHYEYDYYGLEDDLELCTKNTCWKNTYYIFKKLYKYYELCETDITYCKHEMESIERVFPLSYEDNEIWTKNNLIYESYDTILENIAGTMKKYFKKLFVYSLDYLGTKGVRKFFRSFPKVLKPSMFSDGESYAIDENDLGIMIPYFKKHEVTDSDTIYLSGQDKEAQLALTKSNSSSSTTSSYDNEQLDKLRSEALKNYSKNKYSLNNAAIKKGSSGVYNMTIERYSAKGQNSPRSKVKFRTNPLNNLDLGLESAFNDDTSKYIVPRNRNMKSLYVLLSSVEIYGENRMVNKLFYNRCKCPTMNVLNASADKVKGILGSSLVVQSMFDLSNAVDVSGYNFVKRTEQFYFDPRKHISNNPLDSFENLVNSYYDPKIGKFISKDYSDITEDDGTQFISDGPLTVDSNNGSNPKTNSSINGYLDNNNEAKSFVLSSIRYAKNIPMIKKRDMLISCLSNIYDCISAKEYENINAGSILSLICEYVFGKVDVTSKEKIYDIFEYSTNDSLVLNCKNLLAMSYLGLTSTVIKSLNTSDYSNVVRIIDILIKLFGRELSVVGFTRSLGLYDREFLASYFKLLFNNEMNYLKQISGQVKENETSFLSLFPSFYNYKDSITSKINIFDRKGIFGYSDKNDRIQYTNVIIGDWNCICKTSSGTFAGGSDNTLNNGIRRLDEYTNTFVETNITDGNWTDIFEYDNKTFFVRDNVELFVLDDNGVIKSTGITNFNEYEKIHIGELNMFILAGLNNNGAKYWNGSKFVSLSNSGSGWKIKNIKYGYVLYSTNSQSPIFTINKNKTVTNTGLSKRVTDISYTVKTNRITSSLEEDTVTSITYSLFIIVGTYSDGIYELSDSSDIENVFNLTNLESKKSSLMNWDGIVIPVFRTENMTNFLTKNKEYQVIFDSEGIGTSNGLGVVVPPSVTGSISSIGENYPDVNHVRIFTNYIYLDTENGVYIKDLSNINTPVYITTINKNDLVDYKFTEYETIIFAKTSNNENLYIFDTDKHSLLTGIDWKPIKINNKIFIVNDSKESTSGGIYTLDYNLNNVIVNITNIDSGKWKLNESDDYIFALSILGTNRGIKITDKTNILFKDLPNIPVTYGDIGANYNDKERNIIYFGQERSNYVLKIDDVKVDLDEYILPLYDYQLVKLIESIEESKTYSIKEMLLDSLINSSDETTLSVISDINTILTDDNENFVEIEKKSDIYQDLFIYSKSKEEFDIDDNDVLNSVLLDIVNDYEYTDNDTNAENTRDHILLSIEANTRKTIIQNQYGNEYDSKNNMLSDEFLNEDPSTL